MTEYPVQKISSQLNGDDVEFQDWRDGGLPSCCLSLRRMLRSSAVGSFCEITWKGREIRRRMMRNGSGIWGNDKCSLDIWDDYR